MITHGKCFYESTQQLSLPSKHATLHNKIKHRPLTFTVTIISIIEHPLIAACVLHYVNDLIDSLRATNVGCSICNVLMGCLMYAEDLILISPTVGGLQSMLTVCSGGSRGMMGGCIPPTGGPAYKDFLSVMYESQT